MQKAFIVKEMTPDEGNKDLDNVNQFVGKTGSIVSCTPFNIAAGASEYRLAGRILIVADDGKTNELQI